MSNIVYVKRDDVLIRISFISKPYLAPFAGHFGFFVF